MDLHTPEVFIAAGEESGDRYAGQLIARLREREPGVRISGLGGREMAKAGLEWFEDLAQYAAMGIVNVARNLPGFARVFRRAVSRFTASPPSVFVPIDNPGFNLRLAAAAQARRIPVVYYVSPQVWAWLPHRIRRIARSVDHMLAILPFEEKLYRAVDLPCTFVGHPLIDYLGALQMDAKLVESLSESEGPLVGLLPGSRRQEVMRNFPIILKAAERIGQALPETRFAVGCAHAAHVDSVRGMLRGSNVDARIMLGRTAELMRASRVCLVVSGTATMELAYFRTPMVVVYKVAPVGRLVCRWLIRTPHVCLVNIVAGAEVVPEFLMFGDEHEAVADRGLELLTDDDAWTACRDRLGQVIAQLGGPGASARAAEAVLSAAHSAGGRSARPC